MTNERKCKTCGGAALPTSAHCLYHAMIGEIREWMQGIAEDVLHPPPSEYTVREASEELGVSLHTVYRWLYDGVFENAYRMRGGWRIPRSDVQDVKEGR